jgi:hypothetical protein
MHSSVISRWFFIFLALLVFASCTRAGGKIEAGKGKSAKKTAVSGTVKGGSTPKRTTSNTTTSKKTDVDYNGVTQFHAP